MLKGGLSDLRNRKLNINSRCLKPRFRSSHSLRELRIGSDQGTPSQDSETSWMSSLAKDLHSNRACSRPTPNLRESPSTWAIMVEVVFIRTSRFKREVTLVSRFSTSTSAHLASPLCSTMIRSWQCHRQTQISTPRNLAWITIKISGLPSDNEVRIRMRTQMAWAAFSHLQTSSISICSRCQLRKPNRIEGQQLLKSLIGCQSSRSRRNIAKSKMMANLKCPHAQCALQTSKWVKTASSSLVVTLSTQNVSNHG